jgi:hypothetical protein
MASPTTGLRDVRPYQAMEGDEVSEHLPLKPLPTTARGMYDHLMKDHGYTPKQLTGFAQEGLTWDEVHGFEDETMPYGHRHG